MTNTRHSQFTISTALVSLLALQGGQAFVTSPASTHFNTVTTKSWTSSSLQLVPGQGNQLVAAYNAAMVPKENDEGSDISSTSKQDNKLEPDKSITSKVDYHPDTGIAIPAAARNLVQRAFSLPSSMIQRHPHPKEEGLPAPPAKNDICYYPVVGFTFCRNGDQVVALPTASNVSCKLPPARQGDVYGWFSPVCKLDLYSEDPCHAPLE